MFIQTEARDVKPGDLLYLENNFYVSASHYGSAVNAYEIVAADGRRITLNANDIIPLNRPVRP
jgi:hypothetical protein